jgi:Uma2 family endonuclease
MDIAVKAIETTGTVDAQRQLVLDELLPIVGPAKVRVIILVPKTTEIDAKEWYHAADSNPAFDFLREPEEDIYDSSKIEDRIYTHEDLERFPDQEIWELIEGIPCQLAPPSVKHQEISGELFRQFSNYLLDKPCKVFAAPFGVYLPDTNKKNNFIVPDLTIVCEKITGDKYKGVPSLVIEIISPANDKPEFLKKFKLYQKLGIKEYWVIYPESKIVTIFRLNQNNKYELADYEDEARKFKVGIFEDLEIDFDLVFRK